MIVRKKMGCLVTAGKHINNTLAITRQPLGKEVPVTMNTYAMVKVLLLYNNGIGVFYVVLAEILYKQGQSSSVVVSSQQFS
jgi:hypothetical protein